MKNKAVNRDVTEPAEIRFRRIHILCFKSVGFRRGFDTRSQLVPLNSNLWMSVYIKQQNGRHILVPFDV